MAKKKSEIKGDELIGGVLADAPRDPNTADLEHIIEEMKAPKVEANGFAITKLILGHPMYLSRDGLWAEKHLALRFHAAEDAQAYNALHCESAFDIVEA